MYRFLELGTLNVRLISVTLTEDLVKMIKNDLTKIVSNNFRIEHSKVVELTNKIRKFYLKDKKPEEITKEDLLDVSVNAFFYYSSVRIRYPLMVYFKYVSPVVHGYHVLPILLCDLQWVKIWRPNIHLPLQIRW